MHSSPSLQSLYYSEHIDRGLCCIWLGYLLLSFVLIIFLHFHQVWFYLPFSLSFSLTFLTLPSPCSNSRSIILFWLALSPLIQPFLRRPLQQSLCFLIVLLPSPNFDLLAHHPFFPPLPSDGGLCQITLLVSVCPSE